MHQLTNYIKVDPWLGNMAVILFEIKTTNQSSYTYTAVGGQAGRNKQGQVGQLAFYEN